MIYQKCKKFHELLIFLHPNMRAVVRLISTRV